MFTDAGFLPDLGIGAWAAVAECEGRGTLRCSGVLRGNPGDSTRAEVQAVANGLHYMVKVWNPPAGTQVVVHTDCTNVSYGLRRGGFRSKRAAQRMAAEIATIRAATIERGMTLECVVEPSRGEIGRCDRECSRLLREERNRRQSAVSA